MHGKSSVVVHICLSHMAQHPKHNLYYIKSKHVKPEYFDAHLKELKEVNVTLLFIHLLSHSLHILSTSFRMNIKVNRVKRERYSLEEWHASKETRIFIFGFIRIFHFLHFGVTNTKFFHAFLYFPKRYVTVGFQL